MLAGLRLKGGKHMPVGKKDKPKIPWETFKQIVNGRIAEHRAKYGDCNLIQASGIQEEADREYDIIDDPRDR
jgi:hypothetical protein